MACIAPLLQKLYKKIGTNRFIFLIIALFIVDTIAVNYLPNIQNYILNIFVVDYILYTIGYGIILMFSMVIRNLNRIICEIIRYISIHSIWIYLWHIPFIDLIDYISSTHSYWFIKWLFSYSGAILIVLIQNKIVNILLKQGNGLKKYLT